MNELDRKLYELLGDKTLSFGCVMENEWASEQNPNRYFRFYQKHSDTIEGFSVVTGKRVNIIDDKISKTNVIGHEPTLTDLHRWMNANKIGFAQYNGEILCTSFETGRKGFDRFDYDCTRSLLSQSEETKLAIVNLIESNGR